MSSLVETPRPTNEMQPKPKAGDRPAFDIGRRGISGRDTPGQYLQKEREGAHGPSPLSVAHQLDRTHPKVRSVRLSH